MSAVVGHKGLAYIVKRYRKQSYVNFVLATAIVASTIAMVTLESIKLSDEGVNVTFHSICDAHE